MLSRAVSSRTPTASVHSVSHVTTVSSMIHVAASPVSEHDDDSQSEFAASDFEDPNPTEWPNDMPENNAHLSNEAIMLIRSNLHAWLCDAFQNSYS